MKYNTHLLLALISACTANTALAGSPETPATLPSTSTTPTIPTFGSSGDWLKFSLSARARIEARNEQGLDGSLAGTLRVRPGFTIGEVHGFSAFVETEHTYAFIEDFNGGAGADSDPNVAGNTVIADPESNDLNQFYLNYKYNNFQVRVGRQRIILDNAAHIGNVGWRQNEQTYDAATLTYKSDSFSAHYSYVDRVERIFGSDANGALGSFEDGDGAHLVNLKYKVDDSLTLGAYAYILDFDQGAFANSDTYGISADFKGDFGTIYAEIATQSGHDTRKNSDALYSHVKWTKPVNDWKYTLGVEYLEEGFRAPLSTAHAFGGWADRFLLARLNAGPATFEGLSDVYLSAGTQWKGVKLSTIVHGFWDDSFSEFYGWEIDAVAAKKLTENLTLLGKASFYFGDSGADSAFTANDISQVSVQLDYSF